MVLPATIRAGDSVAWVEATGVDHSGDPVTSADWVATAYLRTNTASEGATVAGVARADGAWDFTIAAATTAGFDAGTWYWQISATYNSEVVTLGAGTFTVLASLSYSGTPAAFSGASQAETDLAAVQAAIRAIVTRGAQQYSIGSRSYSALNLKELMERETYLKSVVARERRAEKVAAGLGDPFNLYVKFG